MRSTTKSEPLESHSCSFPKVGIGRQTLHISFNPLQVVIERWIEEETELEISIWR